MRRFELFALIRHPEPNSKRNGVRQPVKMISQAMRISGLLKDIDVSALPLLQRVLLVTDGTVTETIEAMFLEPVELVKVGQRNVEANDSHLLLDPRKGEAIMERKILLRGSHSRTNYVYAESLIATDRLSPEFRRGLVESGQPLGGLWIQHRLETFKEFIDAKVGADREIPAEFAWDPATLIVRTYRVYSGGSPVIAITEHFPPTFRADVTS